jgi:hypothetical protein
MKTLSDVVARYRHEIVSWALPAAIAAVGTLAAFLLATFWLAIVGTALGGAVRVGMEIGRRERTADLEQRLRTGAIGVVGLAARELVLERTLWRDEKATELLRRALIDGRLGRPKDPNYIPYVPTKSWSLEEAVELGERFDIRAHEAGDWLLVESELQRAHDDFASAVGPYTVDLDPDSRRSVAECLTWLGAAKQDSASAFRVLYVPGTSTDDEIREASDTLAGDLAGAAYAARELVEAAERMMGR